MPYQVGSACFDSALAAVQALAASHVPVTTNDHLVSVASVSESSITYLYTPVSGSIPPFQAVQAITLQPCNLLTAQDGLEMAWLIGGVWIAVYAIKFIAIALRGESGGDYGGNA